MTGRVASRVRLEPGRVSRVILSRPPVNVLDLAMIRDLHSAFQRAASSDPAVIVLGAEGRAFSAGVDIADHTEDRVAGMLESFHAVFKIMASLPAPLVAAVQGAALGGGCELVAACDLVVAAASATFGQPEIRVGVFPPVAAVELQALLGPRRAAEMILTGESLDAREALAAGLVNRVYPDETFAACAEEFIGSVSRHSRPVLALAKQALRLGRGRPLAAALPDIEAIYLHQLMALADAREGLQAFMDKRPPRYQDR
ncbi:MAG: enoyl-CoA hydratase/isomerase family protein [Acidobacteriota bacterium]